MTFHAKYDKVKVLGEGAFGVAHLVQKKDSSPAGASLVAKEIRIAHLTEKQREAALAESNVLKMMSHRNIIAYVASFLEGSRMYIIMEYADGGDLAMKIKERKENGKFEESYIMFVFVQVALALNHIHSRKVLHRDLKPLNIFLTKQGVVKLGDFGIAKIIESTSQGAQTTIGTPHYLSPEMCNNEAYGVKSDLWSLGVVTYEMAVLRVPFSGSTVPAVALKILGAEPAPLPGEYSRDLSGLVFCFLEKEPASRPHLEKVLRLPFVQSYISEDMMVKPGQAVATASKGDMLHNVGSRQQDKQDLHGGSRKVEAVSSVAPEVSKRQSGLPAAGAAVLAAGRPVSTQAVTRATAALKASQAVPNYEENLANGERRKAEVKQRAQELREEQEAQRRRELARAAQEYQEDQRRAKQRYAEGLAGLASPARSLAEESWKCQPGAKEDDEEHQAIAEEFPLDEGSSAEHADEVTTGFGDSWPAMGNIPKPIMIDFTDQVKPRPKRVRAAASYLAVNDATDSPTGDSSGSRAGAGGSSLGSPGYRKPLSSPPGGVGAPLKRVARNTSSSLAVVEETASPLRRSTPSENAARLPRQPASGSPAHWLRGHGVSTSGMKADSAEVVASAFAADGGPRGPLDPGDGLLALARGPLSKALCTVEGALEPEGGPDKVAATTWGDGARHFDADVDLGSAHFECGAGLLDDTATTIPVEGRLPLDESLSNTPNGDHDWDAHELRAGDRTANGSDGLGDSSAINVLTDWWSESDFG